MKAKFTILLWVNAIIILLIGYTFFDLIRLLHDGFGEYKVPSRVFEGEWDVKADLKIPKIIHQVYFKPENGTMPESWQEAQQSIKKHHPDYKYVLWDEGMAHEFMEENYPWFLPTYDAYPLRMMRIDALRYFFLYHYGGMYIDLDYGASESFDRLLVYPAWLRKTHPTGVSNDMLGTIPGHPFYKLLIHSLEKHCRVWWFPYLTVMYSTGPLFVSIIAQKFKNNLLAASEQIRFLYPSEAGDDVSRLVYRVEGSSWHEGDAFYFLFIEKHPILFALLIIALIFTFLYAQLAFYQYILSGRSRTRNLWRRMRTKRSVRHHDNDLAED